MGWYRWEVDTRNTTAFYTLNSSCLSVLMRLSTHVCLIISRNFVRAETRLRFCPERKEDTKQLRRDKTFPVDASHMNTMIREYTCGYHVKMSNIQGVLVHLVPLDLYDLGQRN